MKRLWFGIEELPLLDRTRAIEIIKKIIAHPLLEINDLFEMVYNGETQHSTNIIQLIRGEVRAEGQGRILLPGKELFDRVLDTAPDFDSKKLKNDSPPEPLQKQRKEDQLNPYPGGGARLERKKTGAEAARARSIAKKIPKKRVSYRSPAMTRSFQKKSYPEHNWP